MKKTFLPALSFLLVFGLIASIWACFAPGFMSYDSVVQYQSALDQHYTDSHPAIMSYVWHLCMQLVPGPQSLLYLHLTLLALGVFIWQANFRNSVWSLLVPALFMLPWVINFAGVLWKDVGMAFSLLIATGLLFTRRKSMWLALLSMPFLFYAIGVRHNAVLAVIPILFLAFRHYFPKAPIWLGGLTTILLTGTFLLTVFVVTYSFINAEKKHYETFLMGDDIATISAKTHQNLLPWVKDDDLNTCSAFPILYERAMCFISKGYDPSGSLVVNIPYDETYSLWKRTIFSYPFEYALVRIEAFFYFLRPPQALPGYTWFYGIAKNDMDIRLVNPEMAGVLEQYMISTNKTVLSELFKPYVWLLLATIILGWVSRIPPSIEKTQIIVLNTSALGCFFSLLIAVPSVDFRYVYWCVIATTLSVVILASTFKLRSGHKTECS
jgi:hypothetical protein